MARHKAHVCCVLSRWKVSSSDIMVLLHIFLLFICKTRTKACILSTVPRVMCVVVVFLNILVTKDENLITSQATGRSRWILLARRNLIYKIDEKIGNDNGAMSVVPNNNVRVPPRNEYRRIVSMFLYWPLTMNRSSRLNWSRGRPPSICTYIF